MRVARRCHASARDTASFETVAFSGRGVARTDRAPPRNPRGDVGGLKCAGVLHPGMRSRERSRHTRTVRPYRPRGVRVGRSSAGSGRGHRCGRERTRHPRRLPHRRRQVGRVPDRGLRTGRDDRGHLAAPRPAARPDRLDRRGPRRPRRRRPELPHRRGRQEESVDRHRGPRRRVRLPGARAARQRGGLRPTREGRRASRRHRRGALRLGLGPRLPPRLRAHRRRHRSARPPPRCWP